MDLCSQTAGHQTSGKALGRHGLCCWGHCQKGEAVVHWKGLRLQQKWPFWGGPLLLLAPAVLCL